MVSVKPTLHSDLCTPFLSWNAIVPGNLKVHRYHVLTGSYPTIQHYYIKYFFQPNPGVSSPYTAGIAGTLPTGFSALNPSVVLFTLKITGLQLMTTVFLSHLLLPENQKLSHSCQPPGHSAVSAAALGLFGSFALDGASPCRGFSGRNWEKYFYLAEGDPRDNGKLLP